MDKIEHIGITCRSNLDNKDRIIEKIVDFFSKRNIRVSYDKRIKKQAKRKKWSGTCSIVGKKDRYSLMMVLGGDGTMLRAIRENLCHSDHFFGINMGNLGFLAEVGTKDLEGTLKKIVDRKFNFDSRDLLQITVTRKGKKVVESIALNEIVVDLATVSRLVHLPTKVNGKDLTTYFADGLIVSTPTGSTAYNLSVGGPIVHPDVCAFILAPIAAHSLTQKPILVPNDREITIDTSVSKYKLKLTVDGQEDFPIQPGDQIHIKRYGGQVHFLRLKSEDYYKTIRRKLGWGKNFVT